jgi:hypothetical protein
LKTSNCPRWACIKLEPVVSSFFKKLLLRVRCVQLLPKAEPSKHVKILKEKQVLKRKKIKKLKKRLSDLVVLWVWTKPRPEDRAKASESAAGIKNYKKYSLNLFG